MHWKQEACERVSGSAGLWGEKRIPAKDIAEKLNDFFSRVCWGETYTRNLFLGNKEESEVSQEEMLQQIPKLKNRKSPRLDIIHPGVLKEMKNGMAELQT